MKKNQTGYSLSMLLSTIFLVAVILAVGWYVWRRNDGYESPKKSSDNTIQPTSDGEVSFDIPKKGAHFETSTPAHASTLAAVPVDVVLDFNFDLADNSTIRIEKDGKDYAIGDIKFDVNKLTMRRQMDKSAPDGVYTVNYDGCWPDRSCHDGYFQFAIDRSLVKGYSDMRNQKAVIIGMSDIKFQPMNLRVSSGTTVTWINDDDVTHYVNTDSHPAHSHVPGLNSRALAPGQKYSFMFSGTGAYPYHCSAHAADMSGNIVVE